MEEETQTLPGGWSPYHDLTPNDRKVFDEAIEGIVGVDYTPSKVSTQVIAGMNYRFKCTASAPPALVVWEAIVEIVKPLHGRPFVKGILPG